MTIPDSRLGTVALVRTRINESGAVPNCVEIRDFRESNLSTHDANPREITGPLEQASR